VALPTILVLFGRTTFIAFAENQLAPSSIGISPLSTNLPRLLQQSRVRSSSNLIRIISNCSWIDHLVSGPINTNSFSFSLRLFNLLVFITCKPTIQRVQHFFSVCTVKLDFWFFSTGFPLGFYHSLAMLFNFHSRYLFSIGVCTYLVLEVWYPHLQTSS